MVELLENRVLEDGKGSERKGVDPCENVMNICNHNCWDTAGNYNLFLANALLSITLNDRSTTLASKDAGLTCNINCLNQAHQIKRRNAFQEIKQWPKER